MQAGKLRERVEIQTATTTRDDFNAEVMSWVKIKSVWAQVVERGGREPVLADRPVMLTSYEVTIRSEVTVTHANRLIWRSKTLAIDTVTPLPADGMIVLRCLEAAL